MGRVLIVDDEPSMVEVIAMICTELGHQVFPFTNGQKAIDSFIEVAPDLIISDLKLRTFDGMEVLKAVRETLPQIPVILITAYASVETALGAMRMGAYDYIIKPFKIDDLQHTIQRALEFQQTVRENVHLKHELKDRYRFENIVGTSLRMQETYGLMTKVANTDSTILIQGESGTGKELVARALHFNSDRAQHPFVAINCSALPENLLESELFGHKKGAFSGAVQDKVGLFEEAQFGTIFLDEVNSMHLALQTKLLRVLQERQIRRVGDTKTIVINVRVLAATNESLQEKIKAGDFREDLYYRLAVIPLEIPPLRERLDDIPLLVSHFLHKNAERSGAAVKTIQPAAIELLNRYRWPGNVRELENVIERACALCDDGVIHAHDLPSMLLENADAASSVDAKPLPLGESLDVFLRAQERFFIEETLNFNDGSREKTAKMLEISPTALNRKLDEKSES